MKISVDNEVCDGHGMCYVVDPDLFPLDEDGYCAIGVGKQVPAGEESMAREGVDACPVGALRIDEE